jgi:SAM-dependent methyltransferase
MPAADELIRYYGDQQEPNEWEVIHYVEDTPGLSAGWSLFAERLTRLNRGPGKLLEVGPDAGHLLRAARDQGWSVVGVEASPKFARILRKHDIAVHQGVLETFDCEGQFDLIVLLDVLEHLHDPVADLARCRRLLKPNGRIVISTCDIGSFAARYYGLKWRQLVISHTFYWTKRSLKHALSRAGLDLIQISSFRWWDPDSIQERHLRRKEFAKLLVRKAVQLTWIPVTKRIQPAHRFQRTFRGGRFDDWVTYKIGDQAVMSEVVLAVARPEDR